MTYFNDETLSEIGAYYDSVEPPDYQITEADYYAEEREREVLLANCEHRNTEPHPLNDTLEICADCGITLGEEV